MTDEQYMRRCLQLARIGHYEVAPNPMVGAVVVCEGQIIGEGWHQRYGQPHAEVNAIQSVADKEQLAQATLYVNLEPCSHYGKTPPCADLLIRHRLRRVVVGSLDPNPQVAGRGVQKLREAGIEVTVGVLEAECRQLNKRFLCLHEQHRPYVILKWAQSSDGYLDRRRQSVQEPVAVLSSPFTKQLTHQLRAENMAILVGTNTAVLDNPRLRTTRWSGRDPLRVVYDRQGRIPRDCHIFDDENYLLLGDYSWPATLRELASRNIHSVLVEGGATVLNSILADGTWDEAHIEVAPCVLGDGVPAPAVQLPASPSANYDGHLIYSFIHP